MRILLFVAVAATLAAQGDPAFDAYRAWDATQHGVEYRTRAQNLLDVSAEWVAKWPNSDFAWGERREALVSLTAGMREPIGGRSQPIRGTVEAGGSEHHGASARRIRSLRGRPPIGSPRG